MKLPFIQHIGIGLHITNEAIRWVELSRIHDQIWVRSEHAERVEEGDVKRSLSNLVERINPSWNYVTVNIDRNHVRQKLVDVRAVEDEEYLEGWLREQKEAMVPAGLNREDFVLSHRFIGRAEDGQQCLLLITSKEAVEARINLLASAGLQPYIITTGDLETGYAFIFDEEFTSGESCLVKVFEDYSSLQLYSQGVLTGFMELAGEDASVSEVFEEAETHLATADVSFDQQKERTLLAAVSERYLTKDAVSRRSGNTVNNIPIGSPLANVKSGDTYSDSDVSVAAGMAVKQIYPALDTVNFLEDRQWDRVQEKVRKKDAVNTGLILGGFIALVFTLLMTLQFFLKTKLDEAQQQIALLDDKITAVTEARERVAEFEQRVNQARQLVGERTDIAGLLELAGRAVPQRVWLNEVSVLKKDNGAEASLYGFAHNDALVASLMERLEKEREVNNVRLILSETMAAEDVRSRFNTKAGPLVQFEVRMSVRSGTL